MRTYVKPEDYFMNKKREKALLLVHALHVFSVSVSEIEKGKQSCDGLLTDMTMTLKDRNLK